MNIAQVEVGGIYRANVSGKRVDVEVLEIIQRYEQIRCGSVLKRRIRVRNLATGRELIFKSASRLIFKVNRQGLPM